MWGKNNNKTNKQETPTKNPKCIAKTFNIPDKELLFINLKV